MTNRWRLPAMTTYLPSALSPLRLLLPLVEQFVVGDAAVLARGAEENS